MELKSERIKAVDILRGATIGFMLLSENTGNPERIYPQLLHAKWNGVTLADFAFPLFILLLGIVVPVSINSGLNKGKSYLSIIVKVFIRSFVLFFIGLLLNGFPIYDLSIIRIPGVLQRLAVVYIFTSLIYLLLKKLKVKDTYKASIIFGLSLVILLIYYLMFKYLTVPGYGKGIFEPKGNIVQYFDIKYLKGHLYTPTWDPEGILSTIPALSTGLLGALIGIILNINLKKDWFKPMLLSTIGGICLLLAFFSNKYFPFNKNLWSSSFVLLTGGTGIMLTAILYVLADILKFDRVFKPLMILGGSPIFVYTVSELIRKTLWRIPIIDKKTGQSLLLNRWITANFITPWCGPVLDSIYFAIIYVLLWIYVMYKLYKNQIHIKI